MRKNADTCLLKRLLLNLIFKASSSAGSERSNKRFTTNTAQRKNADVRLIGAHTALIITGIYGSRYLLSLHLVAGFNEKQAMLDSTLNDTTLSRSKGKVYLLPLFTMQSGNGKAIKLT